MTFFDQPPPASPARPDYRTPEWLAPPDNVMPATVALDALLVRRDDLAIWVADGLAYPSGLAFAIFVSSRSAPEPPSTPPFLGPVSGDGPRFGLLLADGQKVFVGRFGDGRALHEQPLRSVLHPRGGGGGAGHSRADMWLWPLPPPGPLRFVCEWPAEGVAESGVEVDATPIAEAAARAVELWPDARPLPPDEGAVVI